MASLTLPELRRLVAAGIPLLHIQTEHEARTLALIRKVTEQGLKGLEATHTWHCAESPHGSSTEAQNELCQLLHQALAERQRCVYILQDMHWFWHDCPVVQRLLLQAADHPQQHGKTFILVTPPTKIPPELQTALVQRRHAPPQAEEIHQHLQHAAQRDPHIQGWLQQDSARDKLAAAALGLGLREIDYVLRLGRVGNLDWRQGMNLLHQHKKALLEQSGIMEFVEVQPQEASVGGLEKLKAWLAKREEAFGLTGLQQGQNLPKGVLIMGISGCGKSLFVKAIAQRWQLPLLRLDMGTVYAGAYGSPESSLQLACRTAETLAPCVLWIDELEAGITQQGFKSEGGSSSRVLGSFLTWMQEKSAPVFVAATANAIEMLPAEVLRKGRFDEIFYVPLPGVEARQEIFHIQLAQLAVAPQEYNLQMLAHSSKGFSGAEIEQAVRNADFEAMAQKRQLQQQDILTALSQTVPMSVTMAEQIKRIEAWAFKRAVIASDSREPA